MSELSTVPGYREFVRGGGSPSPLLHRIDGIFDKRYSRSISVSHVLLRTLGNE